MILSHKFIQTLLLLGCLIYFFPVTAVQAETFQVTNLNDSGIGSFRQAISDSNSTPSADIINFQTNLSGTINLLSALPGLSSDVVINGVGADVVPVRRSDGAPAFRIFTIGTGITVVINDLTIQNGVAPTVYNEGYTSGYAGGIYNKGTLTLNNCKLIGNRVEASAADGGGIYNEFVLTLVNTELINNYAHGYPIGCPLCRERGSGILNYYQTFMIDSSISGITTPYSGYTSAAIWNETRYDGQLSLWNSSIINNQTTGIVFKGGTLNLINSTVANNSARMGISGALGLIGGIEILSHNGPTTANIINSTISGNSGDRVGGIYVFAGLNLISSTVTNNTASNGRTGGIHQRPGTTLHNTIVAGNVAGSATSDVFIDTSGFNPISSYNLIGVGAENNIRHGINGNIVGTPASPLNPHLSPLGNYGGRTLTHQLLPNSPAINAGNNARAADLNGNLLSFDQRGACFERFVGGTVDIGAFEAGATAVCNTKFDFDGDGRSDISVFRPSDGTWYLQQSTAGFNGVAFGASGDLLTPADFDGDGKTDIAVFRPSDGTWYLQRSTLGFTSINFGTNGDILMPADFDGDGKADVAVFRPSNGTWYIQQSTAGFIGTAFGANGDVPVAADYDGDGKADIAVFRPSNGTWYMQQTTAGFTGAAFGTTGDKPVPADYDGDGKTDLAVFRPSSGTWYLQRSQTGFTSIQFGASGDLPVAADYDGDGKADVAVFRDGIWYLNRSIAGFIGISFGTLTDKPVPNAFVR